MHWVYRHWTAFLQKTISSLGNIWFDRFESRDRAVVSRRLQEHINDPENPPLLIFPEGTCYSTAPFFLIVCSCDYIFSTSVFLAWQVCASTTSMWSCSARELLTSERQCAPLLSVTSSGFPPQSLRSFPSLDRPFDFAFFTPESSFVVMS